MRNTDPRKWYC